MTRRLKKKPKPTYTLRFDGICPRCSLRPREVEKGYPYCNFCLAEIARLKRADDIEHNREIQKRYREKRKAAKEAQRLADLGRNKEYCLDLRGSLAALSAGKRISHHSWEKGRYIEIGVLYIQDERGNPYDFGKDFQHGWRIWREE